MEIDNRAERIQKELKNRRKNNEGSKSLFINVMLVVIFLIILVVMYKITGEDWWIVILGLYIYPFLAFALFIVSLKCFTDRLYSCSCCEKLYDILVTALAFTLILLFSRVIYLVYT